MSIYVSSLTLEAVSLDGENPLPRFCDPVQNRPLTHDGTFLPEDELYFGVQTGMKILPYAMQDRYTRVRSLQTIKTIVLENDRLKATFLPDYGARLYSLENKQTKKDILYRNEVLQFGNLSQRGAWFSGGIEFNFGHYGHSSLSCSPLFAAQVDNDGESFLRFYEYERVTGGFYQMDFHLPEKSETLDMYVRLINVHATDIPTYWWTNAAVPETPRCRVFCGTSRVLANIPRPGGAPDSMPSFGSYEMPFLPTYDGDSSYPAEIDFSCEYFFRYKNEPSPWEAIGYEDGRLYFEISTDKLHTRKMFCWGNDQGGHRWQRWLNGSQTDRYVELQAGITPTQLHGMMIPANSCIEFTQCFGETTIECSAILDFDWINASKLAEDAVHQKLSQAALDMKHKKYSKSSDTNVKSLLHTGSGWGALEYARLAKSNINVSSGLHFPESCLSHSQLYWYNLLEDRILPCENNTSCSDDSAFMVGKPWRELLEQSLDKTNGKHWESLLHYGVMLLEEGDETGAKSAWTDSLNLKEADIVLRNLAWLHKRNGKLSEAIQYMERAVASYGFKDIAYTEELLRFLVEDKQYEKAWEVYSSYSAPSDYMRVIVSIAAEATGRDDYLEDFFTREFACVRESETILTDVWYRYTARQLGISEEKARDEMCPPENIDFLMNSERKLRSK